MILSTLLGGLLNGKVKNGLAELDERRRIKVKTIHPLRRYAPRPTCLRGTVGWRGDIL